MATASKSVGRIAVNMIEKYPLEFEVLASCSTTKARASKIKLPHSTVKAPVFMPVGTQGTLKGVLPEQLADIDCQIMLGNTYHLGHRPGHEIVEKAGGLHKFMNWDRSLLTDSGGFQMVSLSKLMEIREEGVQFESPHTGEILMLTPEKSIEIQNSLGADIMMQLDDVVHSTTTGPRVEEAMKRSVRWLDRCISANKRPTEQNIFAIIQGGLDPELRKECLREMTKRSVPGFAIGGLSGGEKKDDFWKMVTLCTEHLPNEKPRYVMGVGYALDLVVCVALGADMFDCVFPTRTARFGNALLPTGSIDLSRKPFATDFSPIQSDCPCTTCIRYSRATVHNLICSGDRETNGLHLISIHNTAYQLTLMSQVRAAILNDSFPDFCRSFVKTMYPKSEDVPQWAIDAFKSVNLQL